MHSGRRARRGEKSPDDAGHSRFTTDQVRRCYTVFIASARTRSDRAVGLVEALGAERQEDALVVTAIAQPLEFCRAPLGRSSMHSALVPGRISLQAKSYSASRLGTYRVVLAGRSLLRVRTAHSWCRVIGSTANAPMRPARRHVALLRLRRRIALEMASSLSCTSELIPK